jgi:hypothetical protein
MQTLNEDSACNLDFGKTLCLPHTFRLVVTVRFRMTSVFVRLVYPEEGSSRFRNIAKLLRDYKDLYLAKP